MAFGEAGSITTNSPTENAPITVNLTQPLTNPVFALTATNNGGNQFVLRVIGETLDANGDTTAFTFIIEEWEYHDGPHGAVEDINWIAIEEGVHTLPDGRVVEAGTVSASNTNASVTLTGGFAAPPVVLTSVMSENDTTTVDSDPLNVTAGGFNVRLQEEENEDGVHALETVGYIAIQSGGDANSGTADTFNNFDEVTRTYSLGDTFIDAIVVAETQTINGGDTATVVIDGQSNSDVDLFLEEEQSRDNEMGHVLETVGIVAFEDGLIVACLTLGAMIDTPEGPRAVEALKTGDLVSTYDNGAQPLDLTLSRHLAQGELRQNPSMRPVRILAGALGQGLPKRDLLVSPQHRFLVRSPVAKRMFGTGEVLISANKLTVLPGVFVDQDIDAVTYIHLVFQTHQIIFAEGAPTESFFPGAFAMEGMPDDLLEELIAIFPGYFATGDIIQPARVIPKGSRQRGLVRRLNQNGKPLVDRLHQHSF
ncbi:MAG: Hint domain-containing protein [Pseudomonadota bacterium]